MNEILTIENTEYIPASAAAKQFGYTPDYISKLAREEKIDATRVGRRWYVVPAAIAEFKKGVTAQKIVRGESIRQQRLLEQNQYQKSIAQHDVAFAATTRRQKESALLQTVAIVVLGLVVGFSGYLASTPAFTQQQVAAAVYAELGPLERLAVSVYRFFSPEKETVMYVEDIVVETGIYDVSETENGPEDSLTTEPALPPMNTSATINEYGLVVFPEEDATDELMAVIKDSFSDEIEITLDPDDANTGIIVPQFRETEGNEYRFFVVPITISSSSPSGT